MLRVFSQGFDDINAKFVTLKYLSTMENISTIINTINTNNINILMAPPSLLRQLLSKANDIKVSLKQVVTYAEVLYPEEKMKFEQAFDCKVIEIYQASEGQMASACKHGHLHINEDLVYVELYDAKNQLIEQHGVVGQKMIITNLVNYAQPLIRYEMNDMIVLDDTCSCGSHFRRIKQVLGRHDDLLYFTDSSNQTKIIYPDLFVRWIIVVSDDIREFQVIQSSVNQLDIIVDTLNDSEQLLQSLHQKLRQELSSYDIHHVDIRFTVKLIALPQDKNKFKRFISHL